MREARETQPVGKQEKEGVEEDVGPAVEHGAEEAVEECMVSEEHGLVVGESTLVVLGWYWNLFVATLGCDTVYGWCIILANQER